MNQPGAVALRKAVTSIHPVGDYGIYSNRKIRGGTKMSKHAEGRAWDAKCNSLDPEGLEVGNKLRDNLIKNYEFLGIQKIIWNKQVWTPREGLETYTGLVPHTNHLHIELTWERARDNPLKSMEIIDCLNEKETL